MNKDELARIGINYDEGLKRFSGNAEIYQKFLLQFIDDHLFEELDQAMKDQDFGTAFTAAHTMKGITGNLSMNELYDKLVLFVEMLRGGSDIQEAVEYYPQVSQSYKKMISGLQNIRQTLDR